MMSKEILFWLRIIVFIGLVVMCIDFFLLVNPNPCDCTYYHTLNSNNDNTQENNNPIIKRVDILHNQTLIDYVNTLNKNCHSAFITTNYKKEFVVFVDESGICHKYNIKDTYGVCHIPLLDCLEDRE